MFDILFSFLLIGLCSGAIVGGNQGGSQARSVRLNPYTMKYLQQIASNTRVQQQQRPHQTYPRPQRQVAIKHKLPSKGPHLSLHPLSSSSKLSIQPLGVKPLLVKPVYGQTYLNSKPATSTNNKVAGPSVVNGKYTFAQVNQANTNNGKNVNPILVALPNLGNLLYKYAKRQVETQKTPVYNQNLYHMFGRQTYGPMPVPTATSYTATAHQQQQLQQQQQKQPQQPSAYSQQQYPSSSSSSNTKYGNTPTSNAIYRTKSQHTHQPQVNYRPVPQAPQYQQQGYAAQMSANTGYQSQARSGTSGGYNAQASSRGIQYVALPAPQPTPTQMSYSDTSGNIHIGGGYGDAPSGGDWGGMLYISGPAEEIVNVIHKQQQMPTGLSSPSLTRYTPDVVQLNGDTSSFGKSIGAGTTCGTVPGAFCRDRMPGHYTNPGSFHCFIQCDAFGRGYNKECAPGTSWKTQGPEPALYNMCA